MSREKMIQELESIKILLLDLGENEKVDTINNTLNILQQEDSFYVVTAKYNYDDSFRVDSVWSNEEKVKEYLKTMNNHEKKNNYIFKDEYDYEIFKLKG